MLNYRQIRDSMWYPMQAVLPMAAGTVEHLVVEGRPGMKRNDVPFNLWEKIRSALAKVNSVEIHVHLTLDIDYIDDVLSAFDIDQLHDIRLVLHGSSYRIQSSLTDPANASTLESIQQTVLGLSPKSVTLTAITKRNQHSLLTKVLQESFPALYKDGLTKTVLPAHGAHPDITMCHYIDIAATQLKLVTSLKSVKFAPPRTGYG